MKYSGSTGRKKKQKQATIQIGQTINCMWSRPIYILKQFNFTFGLKIENNIENFVLSIAREEGSG